jgi:chaperone modulatory protein CbpM
MAARKSPDPICEIVATLTLTDLCRICGRPADWVIDLVDEGILEPVGSGRTMWRFESSSITVIAKVRRLQSDLRVNIPGAALVLSLADENARLRRRLLRMEMATDTDGL